MKLLKLNFYSLIFTLLITTINADEKKLKFRGNSNNEEFKSIQINISPDLLNIDKALELKSKYKIAKEFVTKTDQNLKKKKKINSEDRLKIFIKIMQTVLYFFTIQLKEKKALEQVFWLIGLE